MRLPSLLGLVWVDLQERVGCGVGIFVVGCVCLLLVRIYDLPLHATNALACARLGGSQGWNRWPWFIPCAAVNLWSTPLE